MFNQIQIVLEAKKQTLSENQISKALDHLQVSLIKRVKEEFYFRVEEDENIDNISKALNIKQLPEMIHKSQIINYL
jgi:truncated hemoglobin YjbI